MAYTGRFGLSDDFRREELIRVIEHSVENLTLHLGSPTDTVVQASDEAAWLTPQMPGLRPLSTCLFVFSIY